MKREQTVVSYECDVPGCISNSDEVRRHTFAVRLYDGHSSYWSTRTLDFCHRHDQQAMTILCREFGILFADTDCQKLKEEEDELGEWGV